MHTRVIYDDLIKVRVTKQQKIKLQEWLKTSDYRTMSDLIRSLLQLAT